MTARVWLRLDMMFPHDPKVAVLGEEFGPAGMAVMVVLLCQCKAQERSRGVPGEARVGWLKLGRDAYIKRQPARAAQAIVRRAAELGLLDVVESDSVEVTVFLPKWVDKQIARPQAMSGAERTRNWRSRKRVTERDETSHSVTSVTADVTFCDDVTTTRTLDHDKGQDSDTCSRDGNTLQGAAVARAREAEVIDFGKAAKGA